MTRTFLFTTGILVGGNLCTFTPILGTQADATLGREITKVRSSVNSSVSSTSCGISRASGASGSLWGSDPSIDSHAARWGAAGRCPGCKNGNSCPWMQHTPLRGGVHVAIEVVNYRFCNSAIGEAGRHLIPKT